MVMIIIEYLLFNNLVFNFHSIISIFSFLNLFINEILLFIYHFQELIII